MACRSNADAKAHDGSSVERHVGSLTNFPDRPPRIEFTETVFGRTIVDPFRWMEDSTRVGEMAAWVKAASAHARAQLAALPGRARLAATLDSAARSGVGYSSMQEASGRLFALRLDPSASRTKLIVRAPNAPDRVIFDPSAEPTVAVAIGNYAVSPSGRIVAVHTAAGGGEVGRIRFLEVDSGRWRDDELEPVWGQTGVSWIDEESVLFTRMAGPGDPHKNIRLHRLGEPTSRQIVLLANPGTAGVPVGPAEFPIATAHPLSDWTLGFVGGARADTRWLVARDADVRAGTPAWREMVRYDDRVSSADLRSNDLFFITTRTSPNGELRRANVATGTASTSSVVLASGNPVLQSVVANIDGIYVVTLEDGVNRLVFLPDGKPPARAVALDPGTIASVQSSTDGRHVTFALSTWTRASRFFVAENGVAQPLGIENQSYAGASVVEVIMDEAVSSDGTHVPLTILKRRGSRSDGAAPTLLDGYGSYGFALTPFHSSRILVWVERGGIYASCGTRGGGEKGRTWHEAGRAGKKPNAHADFIACAERLIALRLTNPAKLAITAASAGGALAPPAALKRPDLFRVIVPQVAFINATRVGAARNGPNQFAEFGDPNTQDGFRSLAAQDAYLMLDEAKDSPDWLLTIGLNDRRVEPWMSAKFAAKALEKFGSRHLVFLRADSDAGHGVGSTREQFIAEWADIYSFLLNRFGEPAFQLGPTQ